MDRYGSDAMFCRGCQYPLVGLDQDVCPECGEKFDAADSESYLKAWQVVGPAWTGREWKVIVGGLLLGVFNPVLVMAWQNMVVMTVIWCVLLGWGSGYAVKGLREGCLGSRVVCGVGCVLFLFSFLVTFMKLYSYASRY